MSWLDLRFLAARAIDLVAQIAPDAEHQRAIGRVAAQAEHLARPRERHLDDRFDAAWMRRRVVLPQPDGPTIVQKLPRAMSRLMPSSAVNGPVRVMKVL